jgi:hypothetical protein
LARTKSKHIFYSALALAVDTLYPLMAVAPAGSSSSSSKQQAASSKGSSKQQAATSKLSKPREPREREPRV